MSPFRGLKKLLCGGNTYVIEEKNTSTPINPRKRKQVRFRKTLWERFTQIWTCRTLDPDVEEIRPEIEVLTLNNCPSYQQNR